MSAKNSILKTDDRTKCDRCRGWGFYMGYGGPVWCPDCDGSGYEEGWLHEQ